MQAKDTIYAIANHFLILLCLIAGELILKGILHPSQQVLGPITVSRIDSILSYFLIFIVLIFTLFSSAELILHAAKSAAETAMRLFPKTITSKSATQEQDRGPQ